MNNNQAEIVLVVSDAHIPERAQQIPEQFKNILLPNKIQHVLSLGNIGSKDTYEWLKGLSNNFHSIKGEFDDMGNLPESKTVKIGDFNIGMIHGHQVTPWGDNEALSNVTNMLGCDILLSGHTHTSAVNLYEGKHYINPGSFTGSYSPLSPETTPSFMLFVIQGDLCAVYLYELTDNTKLEVSKSEFSKMVEDKEEEEEK